MNPNQNFLAKNAATLRAQQVLGHVASPADLGKQRKQFGVATRFIAAGTRYTEMTAGNYLYLDRAEFTSGGYAVGNEVRAVDSNENTVFLNRPQSGYYFETPFRFVELWNDSAEDVTVDLYVGFGRVQKDAQDSFGYPPLGVAGGALTRPANVTPYAANEVVADAGGATTPIFTQPLAFEKLTLNSLSIVKSSNTVANTAFKAEIWASDPGATNDQDPAQFDFANRAAFMGVIDIDEFVTDGAGSDAAYFSITGINIPVFTTGSQFFFVRLIAQGAYVPTSGEEFFFQFGYTQGS